MIFRVDIDIDSILPGIDVTETIYQGLLSIANQVRFKAPEQLADLDNQIIRDKNGNHVGELSLTDGLD